MSRVLGLPFSFCRQLESRKVERVALLGDDYMTLEGRWYEATMRAAMRGDEK